MPPDLSIAEARAQVQVIVSWLVDNGFPFDWHSTEPAPSFLREPLAQEWARRDAELVENYLWALDQEQEWR